MSAIAWKGIAAINAVANQNIAVAVLWVQGLGGVEGDTNVWGIGPLSDGGALRPAGDGSAVRQCREGTLFPSDGGTKAAPADAGRAGRDRQLPSSEKLPVQHLVGRDSQVPSFMIQNLKFHGLVKALTRDAHSHVWAASALQCPLLP